MASAKICRQNPHCKLHRSKVGQKAYCLTRTIKMVLTDDISVRTCNADTDKPGCSSHGIPPRPGEPGSGYGEHYAAHVACPNRHFSSNFGGNIGLTVDKLLWNAEQLLLGFGIKDDAAGFIPAMTPRNIRQMRGYQAPGMTFGNDKPSACALQELCELLLIAVDKL